LCYNIAVTNESLPRVSGIILAGGQSRRMGRDKAFLDLDGAPLISRVIERVKNLCTEIIIVTNDPDAYRQFNTRLVGDVYAGKGSLGGMFSGLQATSGNYALAVACDMPFLNEDLLRYMISLAPQYDVVIPRAPTRSGKTPRGARGEKSGDKKPPRSDPKGTFSQPIAKESDLHPMHAIYSKNCLAPMEERLRADDLRLIGFHDAVRVRTVESAEVDRFDPQHWSFFNVNTPEDLQLASSIVQPLHRPQGQV
jgi:molybdopterin-guanine dinucleotide biosynthesis protein A